MPATRFPKSLTGSGTSAWRSVAYALVLAAVGSTSGAMYYELHEERFQFGDVLVVVSGFGVERKDAEAVAMVLSEVELFGEIEMDRHGGGFRLHVPDEAALSSRFEESGRLLAQYTKETIYILKYDKDENVQSAARYAPVLRPPPPMPRPTQRSRLWPW